MPTSSPACQPAPRRPESSSESWPPSRPGDVRLCGPAPSHLRNPVIFCGTAETRRRVLPRPCRRTARRCAWRCASAWPSSARHVGRPLPRRPWPSSARSARRAAAHRSAARAVPTHSDATCSSCPRPGPGHHLSNPSPGCSGRSARSSLAARSVRLLSLVRYVGISHNDNRPCTGVVFLVLDCELILVGAGCILPGVPLSPGRAWRVRGH